MLTKFCLAGKSLGESSLLRWPEWAIQHGAGGYDDRRIHSPSDGELTRDRDSQLTQSSVSAGGGGGALTQQIAAHKSIDEEAWLHTPDRTGIYLVKLYIAFRWWSWLFVDVWVKKSFLKIGTRKYNERHAEFENYALIHLILIMLVYQVAAEWIF